MSSDLTPRPSPRPFSWSARGQSFRFAFRGIRVLWATQHNARLHLLASCFVVVGGFLFQISRFEWIAVILAAGLVVTAEALNSAVERLGDAISPEIRTQLRDAKDLAAGAVLLAAAVALAVGLLVFIPHICTAFVRWGGAA